MTQKDQQQLWKTPWGIADQLRGVMNADDFRDYMLSFLFLRYLSFNYEEAAKKELGKDYPVTQSNLAKEYGVSTPLQLWYESNLEEIEEFEKQMRRKVHYVFKPNHLWNSITEMARIQDGELLITLEAHFRYIPRWLAFATRVVKSRFAPVISPGAWGKNPAATCLSYVPVQTML